MIARARTPVLCALATAAVVFACSKKRAAGDAAVSGAAPVLREAPPVIRPAELRGRASRGYLVAASLLSAGVATWRGWLHVPSGVNEPLHRLPDVWQVPYDARVAVSRRGSHLAWVDREGRAGTRAFAIDADGSTALGGIVATDAHAGVAPAFLGESERFVYARTDGGISIVEAGRARTLWRGLGEALVELSVNAAGDRIASLQRGEEVHVTDAATGRTHTAYRARGKGIRLFEPRLLRDGTLFVRERRRRTTALVRVPPAGGDVAALPIPTRGRLRRYTVPPAEDRLWLGLAERGAGIQVGALFEVPLAHFGAADGRADGGLAARLAALRPNAAFARTLPLAHADCDGRAFAVVEESTALARLVLVDAPSIRQRFLTPPHVRLRAPEAVAVYCPR